jgi:serine/threonine protein kinase
VLQTRGDNRTLTFGPFELLGKIGRGACTVVYKARHLPSGKLAAVKVLSHLAGLDAPSLERFKREFTVIRALQHRHLVRAVAFGEEKGLRYIVLEYVPGQSLEQRLKQHGPLSLEDAALVFVQVADGLRYLHTRSILHRDIKPSNIFLTNENTAKLGDFGLLKQLNESSQTTHTNQSLGTVEYGAPEQFEDAKRVDRRCDIFSLAATLYKALAGKFPFGNAGQMQTLQRKLTCQFVPLKVLIPSLNPVIDHLVSRCLDPDPRRRPNDCNEFLEVIGSLFPGPATPSSAETLVNAPESEPKKDRRATIRYNVELAASFVPFHENSKRRWEASILDISPAGLRLQTNCPVTVDSVMQIVIGSSTVTELALVRWVQPAGDGMYNVGCAFVRPLAPKALEAVMAEELMET